MDLSKALKEYGLSEKEVSVYLATLELGVAPVRIIARQAGINRGTAYDILKVLVDVGLVSFYQKGKQHFSAESPERLIEAVEDKQIKLQRLKVNLAENLPQLKMTFLRHGGRPSIRVYEGFKGIKKILEDVLSSVEALEVKEYYVYSGATPKERNSIYHDFPEFNEKRMKKEIKVKTVSLGSGGETVGLDERKWLKESGNRSAATHEIIYAGKVAHIGLDTSGNPIGVIIQNADIYEMQKMIFETIWKDL